jgi:hypothetical protein
VAPILALHVPTRFQGLTYFLTGFGALGLVMWPEGVISYASERFRDQLEIMRPDGRRRRTRVGGRGRDKEEVSGVAAANL